MEQLDWTPCAVTLPAPNSWIPLISASWRRRDNLYWFTYMALHIAQKHFGHEDVFVWSHVTCPTIYYFPSGKDCLIGKSITSLYETFTCQQLILGEAIWSSSRPFVTAGSLTFVLSVCSQSQSFFKYGNPSRSCRGSLDRLIMWCEYLFEIFMVIGWNAAIIISIEGHIWSFLLW